MFNDSRAITGRKDFLCKRFTIWPHNFITFGEVSRANTMIQITVIPQSPISTQAYQVSYTNSELIVTSYGWLVRRRVLTREYRTKHLNCSKNLEL